jgi:hypothetical protein
MTYDEWAEAYQPRANHLRRGEETDLFETYGIELGYVLATADLKPAHVWTLIDGDVGTYVVNGYHLVNRIAYLITKEPFEGDFLEVLDSEYSEERDEND